MTRTKITEEEFAKLCRELDADRKIILKHNPIGTEHETLLWMLMSILISYLSLEENEIPCFTGKPDADTYKDAINFVLRERMANKFETEKHLSMLIGK